MRNYGFHLETEFITEGGPAENFYVLLEGQVRVTKKMAENKEIATSTWSWRLFGRTIYIVGYSLRGDYTYFDSKPSV